MPSVRDFIFGKKGTPNFTSSSVKLSGPDVVFALNPQTSMWAKAGFTADSNWWIWDILGYKPQEADPNKTPDVNGETIFHAIREPGYNKPGWEQLDTSRITDMKGWFSFARSFNQPIGCWDTSRVINMERMFMRADNFDQSLADWDISRVKKMSEMFWECGISSENLSDTLIGWARTARIKGVRKRVRLSRLPYRIHDFSEEAQEAIHYLRVNYRWEIEPNYQINFYCPPDHIHCDYYKRKSKRRYPP